MTQGSPHPRPGGSGADRELGIPHIGGKPPAHDGGSETGDLDQAISAIRARMEEEFRITERLSAKARQVFALSAGFFAVIQTVAFGTFGHDTVSAPERVLLLIVAIIAGVCIAWVARRVAGAEELLPESDVAPEKIVQWAEEANGDPEYVRARLVSNLAAVARERATNNKTRAERYDRVEIAARWALIVTSIELIVAVVVRL